MGARETRFSPATEEPAGSSIELALEALLDTISVMIFCLAN